MSASATVAPSTRELDPAEGQQVQPGGGDDDVGLELARPTASRMPRSVKRLDAVGDDRRAAASDRLEQVAVGHGAQPLVPRVVARAEVRVDGVALGQLALGRGADERRTEPREAAASVVDAALAARCSCAG